MSKRKIHNQQSCQIEIFIKFSFWIKKIAS